MHSWHMSGGNLQFSQQLHNRQYQEIIPKPLAMTTDQTGKNGTIHLPSSKGRSINKNDLSLSDPFAKDDSSKNEVLTKLDSCKNTKKYFNDIDSNNHNYNDESIRWPPQRDVDIYDVVQRTLSNNLVKLWKQHEVLMEKYMENFPGQPSKRRRHSGFHRNRNDQASPTQTNNYHPTPSRQQHQSTFPMNAGDYLSTTLNNNNTNRHNRHKLYLLAREVLLYYEKEYGSHRGTPEAERIIFLRQAISDFTTSGS
ncbi:hypothetical protein BDA99DRAFT_535361 [Phascolomyces articulosus]|uniref:Uncharacterized protein n=1 Tax=Phascolomyces articulosus TaxID=60185 RepID=A0AAD5K534_9FUNG|nr:hypothetical protein BDA99DRAFT_535361 [Phascolomyces articulosus]